MQKFFHYVIEHKLVSLGISFLLFLACLIGFGQIADEVHEGETLWIDETILQTINGFSNSFWDAFFVTITQLGGVIGIITLTIGLLLVLTLRHKRRAAFVLALTVGGAALLNLVLKLIFERARPDLWDQLIVETSYSFPSGHAMLSAALALAVIYIFWTTRYRWPVAVSASLYILVIGLSRLYLGVHYPTDIVAGWLVSGAWLLVVVVVTNSEYLHGKLRILSPFHKRTT